MSITRISFLGVLFVAASAAHAGGKYHITDIGALFQGGSAGTSVNDFGEVAGTYAKDATNYGAFKYSNGVVHDLGFVGYYDRTSGSAYATGINNSGEVTGSSTVNNYRESQAFKYSNGTMQGLGLLGGDPFGYSYYSDAAGINNSGQVVGTTSTNSGFDRAYLYYNGVMHDLGGIGGRDSYGYALNDLGQVTGKAVVDGDNHAFFYSNGVMTDIGTGFGGRDSMGTSINNSGQIVGNADGLGFLYSNGNVTMLGSMYGGYIYGATINNNGVIVGSEYNGRGVYRPYIYSSGTMTDLNTLLDSSGAGWTLWYASDISDTGYITGTGVFNGQSHAFLLTPESVPEPASMFAVGLGLVAIARRRRKG